RTDTLKYLRAQDVFGGAPATLTQADVRASAGPAAGQQRQILTEELRQAWGDYVWWDDAAGVPRPLTRDEVGRRAPAANPKLEGAVTVTLADGSTVRCRPVFDLVKEYAAHFDPKTTEQLTWAPAG